jgi:hypothetical protein
MARQGKGTGSADFQAALASSYWREDAALVVLQVWASSGESLASFAEAHGLHGLRLERWRRRLMPERSPEPVAAVFFPVEIVDSGRLEQGAEAAAEVWHVEVNGHLRIRVPCAGGRRLLVETLEAVREAWPC